MEDRRKEALGVVRESPPMSPEGDTEWAVRPLQFYPCKHILSTQLLVHITPTLSFDKRSRTNDYWVVVFHSLVVEKFHILHMHAFSGALKSCLFSIKLVKVFFNIFVCICNSTFSEFSLELCISRVESLLCLVDNFSVWS